MSGNLWMFSDKLDDEDIEIMKHEFITYYQGADYYGLGLKMFTRLAHEAGAVYKIGKKVLIRRTIFDEYLRQQYHIHHCPMQDHADPQCQIPGSQMGLGESTRHGRYSGRQSYLCAFEQGRRLSPGACRYAAVSGGRHRI